MSEGIIVIGAGGHSKVVADAALSCGMNLIGILDDNVKGEVLNYPVLGVIHDVYKYSQRFSFIIGVGNNSTRKKIAEKYMVNWATIIHPKAIVARGVSICEGSVIMAGAVINPSTVIGKHCIINTSAIVEHDNVIGDYVHVSPNATLCGTVSIGNMTHVGAGAIVKNNTSVCAGCIIGAGAVVVKDITKEGIYTGIPATENKGAKNLHGGGGNLRN